MAANGPLADRPRCASSSRRTRQVWSILRDRGAGCSIRTRWQHGARIEAFSGRRELHAPHGAGGHERRAIRERWTGSPSAELDKFALARAAIIDAELEYKIPPLIATGGCILGLDHRIPNGTPLEGYRYYHRRAWEIIEREEALLG